MIVYLIIAAFGLSSILHYSVQKIFIYYKKFDDFNHRSSHNTLATRTGGIGIFSCLMLISTFFYFNEEQLFDYSLFIPIGIMFIIGVYDDFYGADFKLKFLLQIIVAKILIDQGYAITNYQGLFGIYYIPWIWAQITTVFVFLVIVNSINFIDGIDGLAITEVIKSIALIEFFSFNYTKMYMLGLITIFSMLPLYYFNFKKKQKVFLGDGGSLILGTLIATYIFYILSDQYNFHSNITINKTLFTIILLLYPLIDLLRVFIIRIMSFKSPFHPDQNHLHHYFLNKTNDSTKALIVLQLIILVIQSCLLLFYT